MNIPIFRYEDSESKTLSTTTRKALAEQIKADIDAYCVKEYTGEHRDHLGASTIGQECARKVWYDFRWVNFEIFDGRMLRLFERGKDEEAKFIKLLRGIGCQVWEVDPTTNKQFRIWGVNGHYGGSADSVGILPYFPDLPMLLEFKTHNTKSFVNLVNKGLLLSKDQHYKQMCSYGKHYNFRYGLYVAVNKNDDDIYPEIVELDWRLAHDITNHAQDIIEAKTPPPRIAENPSYWLCKFCSKSDICWDNAPVEINCRSCKNAVAVENAEWKCNKYQQIIPHDFIKQGCSAHESINI
jgi:hypothetical protein